MDQKPGELNQDEETTLKTNSFDNAEVRPATSLDVKESGQDVLDAVQSRSEDLTDEPEQIKEQIQQTRSQMSETIDAIQEKLSFDRISEQVNEQIHNAVETAKGAVYEATLGKAENIMQTVSKGLNNVSDSVGDAGQFMVSSARRNPLPLALIGLGVGMLIFQGTRSSGIVGNGKQRRFKNRGGQNQGNSAIKSLKDSGSNALNSARETVSSAAGSAYESVSHVAGSAYETVGNAASSAYAGAGNAASSAYQGVSSAANSAYQGASNLASSTGEHVQNASRYAKDRYEQTLEDNPLAIGAIALAVGAIVGLAIPTTSYENQLVGEYRENLVQAVEDSARDALSRAQEVAGEFTKTVVEQAKSQAG